MAKNKNLFLDKFEIRDKQSRINDYVTYMLNRTMQGFDYGDTLPETIPKRSLESLLQMNGWALITEVNGSLYAFGGGLGGPLDAYYMPTKCYVANPWLGIDKEYTIGEDAVLVYNDSMLYGLRNMFYKYASLLVESDISFDMLCVNSRQAALFSASDDRTKKAAEKYLSDLRDGTPGIVAESGFVDGIKVQPLTAESTRYTGLIELHQYLKASWFNDIGVNANYNMKREAINSGEAALNDDALLPLFDDMMECRVRGFDRVNEKYGTSVQVNAGSAWKQLREEQEVQLGGEGDGLRDTDRPEPSMEE